MASGGMSFSSETKFHQEIKKQNEYFKKHGTKRNEVKPDENCFFRAVYASAQRRIPNIITEYQDPVKLRKEAIEYVFDHMAEFRILFPGEGKEKKKEIREELMTLQYEDVWAGYESVMAISRLLDVR